MPSHKAKHKNTESKTQDSKEFAKSHNCKGLSHDDSHAQPNDNTESSDTQNKATKTLLTQTLSATNHNLDSKNSKNIESTNTTKDPSTFESYHFTKEGIITLQQFVDINVALNTGHFCWAWEGIIDFTFLRESKIKFIDKVIHEDHPFAMVLFSKATYIYLLPQKLYTHRLRPNSTCNMEGERNVTKASMPTYTLDILHAFKGDAVRARAYYRAASWFIMFLELRDFLQSDNPMARLSRTQFMQLFVDKSRELLSFDIDPLGLLAHFGTLKEYVKKPNSTMRLAMNNPALYKKLLPLIRIYEKFTQIERKARKKLKAIFKGKNRI